MRIAAAKYRIGAPADLEAFAGRQRRTLAQVAADGARIAVLPEYLSLELGASFDLATSADLHASLAAIQTYRDGWIDLFSGLARETGMLVVAGTFLLDTGGGRYRNRCDLFTPDGGHAWQDKPVRLLRDGRLEKEGICRGADDDGALLVHTSAGLERCLSGDLSLRAAR